MPCFMIWTLFWFWGRNLSNFLLVFWKISKNKKDFLKLTDLYLDDAIEARSKIRQNLIKMQNNEDPAICRLCITELVKNLVLGSCRLHWSKKFPKYFSHIPWIDIYLFLLKVLMHVMSLIGISILLHSGLNPAWHFWLSTRFSCCLKMKSVENI